MAKLILFDTETGKLSWVDCAGLDDYYKYLKCDYIDIPTRKVGTVVYDVICDDNGLLIENPVVSAVDKNLQLMLVGNLLFSHHDSEGETTSCTESDMTNLQRHLVKVQNIITGEYQTVIKDMEYAY